MPATAPGCGGRRRLPWALRQSTFLGKRPFGSGLASAFGTRDSCALETGHQNGQRHNTHRQPIRGEPEEAPRERFPEGGDRGKRSRSPSVTWGWNSYGPFTLKSVSAPPAASYPPPPPPGSGLQQCVRPRGGAQQTAEPSSYLPLIILGTSFILFEPQFHLSNGDNATIVGFLQRERGRR